MFHAGIDLGGTKLGVGIVDGKGSVVSEVVTHDHSECDENGILDRMARNTDQALAKAGLSRKDLAGVGVLYPGHVRWPEGITLTTSNLPCLKNFPLKEALRDRMGCPAIVDNDANAQALGEHRYGAGRGTRHMVFLTVSTGVGGGIIINGQLYRGATGTAGEFGHMIVEASGKAVCTCGNRGCLMSLASGLALPQAFRQAAARRIERGGALELPEGCADFDDLDGEHLSAGFRQANPICRDIVQEFATYIGIGIYNVFQTLNPERVVLGGGLLNLPDFFFETVKEVCYARAGAMMYDKLEIRKGELGGRAGILGAATLFDEIR